MTRIEKLTAEQEVLIPVLRAEWLAVGMSTQPADEPRAEAALVEMYHRIGKPAPHFLWCDSPATAVIAMALLRGGRASLRDSLWDSLWDSLGDSLGDSLRDSLWDSLWASLWASLRDSLRASLWDSLGASLGASLWDSLWDSLWASLWDSLRDSLRASLWDSLRASLWDSLGDSLWDSLWDSLRDSLGASLGASLGDSLGDSLRDSLGASRFWGQHDAYWIGYYATIRDIGLIAYDPEQSRRLDLWGEIAKSCGWWWPYDGLVVASRRPTVVAVEPSGPDDRMRLHHPTGPALAYADGWTVHAWHGTRVPQGLIEGRWSTHDILRHDNAEVRRCAIEHMGWDRFVAEAGLRQLGDTVPDPGNPGQSLRLYSVPEQIYNESVNVLIVVNGSLERDGTRRQFGLTTPADITDPLSAVAWTYNLTADEYAAAEVRR